MCFFSKQVEKQSAHFYSVTLTEEESQAGLICKVQSSAKNKFKVNSFFALSRSIILWLCISPSLLLSSCFTLIKKRVED